MQIVIKDKNETITNEVKRMGLLTDRTNEIDLRIGDMLVVYMTKDSNY
jgi:hypothetical protein